MLNEPNDEENRKVHPLERQPQPRRPQQGDGKTGQRVMLHIPVARPRLTYILIGVNVVIYVIAFLLMSDQQQFELYEWGANNHQAVLEFGELHRLFTSMFLHSETILHIGFNMYALYIIGMTVERFFGSVRFALVYFLGGLSGSILSVLLNDASTFSVGASGAVFAIFGAEMVFIYKHRKLLGAMGQAQLRQLIIVAGINFAFGFATEFSNGGIRIDNWAHIGGFLGGLAIAWLSGPIFLLKRHPVNEGAFVTEDVNPLQRATQPLLAYVSGLMILVIAGSLLARGGF